MSKRTKSTQNTHGKKGIRQPIPVAKRPIQPPVSTDGCKQIWIFDSVDRDGHFQFTANRPDMDCKDILDKVINYSRLTWREIMNDTHDNGKSKHHHIEYNGICKQAKERVKKLRLEENIDDIFSMRLNNMVRIIGLRNGQNFVVKWFDPDHEFYPANNK